MDQRAENKKQDLRTVKQGTENTRKERYEDIRLRIKDGDVLMFKGRYFISSIIKWLSRSRYSHAGIVAKWNDRLMVMEADSKGVIVSRISSKVRKYRGKVEWRTCNREISDGDRRKMIDFAQEELGKEFARWKALRLGLMVFFKMKVSQDDKFARKNKLICSEYVASIYNQAGIDLAEGKADQFTSPENIAHSGLLTKMGFFQKIGDSIYLISEEGTSVEVK